MKVIDLLQQRRENWKNLEQYCRMLETRSHRKLGAVALTRFAALYRAACADLALAASYQLPPTTVNYLHQLVGRAHNQLYRSKRFQFGLWGAILFFDIPRRLYHDSYLRLATFIFWGSFLFAMWMSSTYSPMPSFAADLVGKGSLEGYENMYMDPDFGRNFSESAFGTARYISHNTGIGITVFACGLVFGIGGIPATLFNGLSIGAIFGYMTTTTASDQFFEFVTAHGPFELTAIVLSAAAGMRLGFSLVSTGGMTRIDAIRKSAIETMPIMAIAMLLFVLAAIIEGTISPSDLPYWFKATVAIFSSGLMMIYVVMLGHTNVGGAIDAT